MPPLSPPRSLFPSPFPCPVKHGSSSPAAWSRERLRAHPALGAASASLACFTGKLLIPGTNRNWLLCSKGVYIVHNLVKALSCFHQAVTLTSKAEGLTLWWSRGWQGQACLCCPSLPVQTGRHQTTTHCYPPEQTEEPNNRRCFSWNGVKSFQINNDKHRRALWGAPEVSILSQA